MTEITIIGWFMMGFAWGAVVIFLVMLISVKLALREQKRERQIFRKLDMKLIGFDRDECKECHLPGDCPLCGAS